MFFQKTRDFMAKLDLPKSDLYDLPTSGKTFPDGCHYRLEVPTVNSAEALKALLETAEKEGVQINRVDETYGAFRHTTRELKEYMAICKDKGVELNLSVGPRATYDTSATRLSAQGVRIGYRLRGMEQVVRAVEDVKRIAELGGRGVLVYDEGLLWVLNELRAGAAEEHALQGFGALRPRQPGQLQGIGEAWGELDQPCARHDPADGCGPACGG